MYATHVQYSSVYEHTQLKLRFSEVKMRNE